jgi:hypothetical protein
MDAQDLAAEVVRVRRTALVVPVLTPLPLIGLRADHISGVVPHGDVQIPVRIPGHTSTGMAADFTLRLVLEDARRGARHQRVALHLHPHELVFERVRIGIEQVDEVVLLEVRVQRHPHQPLLRLTLLPAGAGVGVVHLDGAHDLHPLRHRVVHLHTAGPALRYEHAPVSQHFEVVRLIELSAGDEHHGSESVVIRLRTRRRPIVREEGKEGGDEEEEGRTDDLIVQHAVA